MVLALQHLEVTFRALDANQFIVLHSMTFLCTLNCSVYRTGLRYDFICNPQKFNLFC